MSVKIVEIKSISKQIRGVSYTPKDVSKVPLDNHIRLLRANNITENGIDLTDTVYVNKKCITEAQKLKVGDILIAASSGSIKIVGKAILIENEINSSFGAFCKVIRPNEKVDYRYLSFYFRSSDYRQKISQLAAGANINNLRNEDLDNLKIPLPPLETQKRIADILDAADALRQKDQELLKKYDELAQAIFIDMFGDPVKNEKEWEITDLKNIVHQDRIVTYGIVQAGQHIDDGIPYIRTGDIKNGEILVNQLQKTSIEIAESYNRSKLYLNDIIMSIRATVGTVALLPDSLVGANLTQGTARISPSDKVNRLYLYYFLKNDFAQNWISENSKGATFREITLTKLRELPILLPPLKLQNQFGDIMSKLLSNNTLLKNQISMSRDFFQSLLQKAFKGELVA